MYLDHPKVENWYKINSAWQESKSAFHLWFWKPTWWRTGSYDVILVGYDSKAEEPSCQYCDFLGRRHLPFPHNGRCNLKVEIATMSTLNLQCLGQAVVMLQLPCMRNPHMKPQWSCFKFCKHRISAFPSDKLHQWKHSSYHHRVVFAHLATTEV